jgi:hypothetical protein
MDRDTRYAPPESRVVDEDAELPKVGFSKGLRLAAAVTPVTAIGVWTLAVILDGFGSAAAAITFVVSVLVSAGLGAFTLVQLVSRRETRTVFSFILAALNFLPLIIVVVFLLIVFVRLIA